MCFTNHLRRVSAGIFAQNLRGTEPRHAYLVSASDAAIQCNAYTPYGAVREFDPDGSAGSASANPLSIERGWLSQVADEATSSLGTGLTYLNARYYDPVASRFISPDPMLNVMDPKTLDPYRYADNNPVVLTDATGLAANCSGLTGLAATYCTSSSNSTAATTTARAKPWYSSATTDSGTGSHSSNACLKFADRAGCPERVPGFNPFSWVGDVADRGSTFVQYVAQSGWRRLNNPLQTVRDYGGLTLQAESLTAAYQILVQDAELYNAGDYCGTEGECLTGAQMPKPNTDAMTIGHTVSFGSSDAPIPTLVEHEFDHVYDYEILGAIGFGAIYGTTYVLGKALGLSDFDAYEAIPFEVHARDVARDPNVYPNGFFGWALLGPNTTG